MSINSEARYERISGGKCGGCFGNSNNREKAKLGGKLAEFKHKMFVKMHTARHNGFEKEAARYEKRYKTAQTCEQQIENSNDVVMISELVEETRNAVGRNAKDIGEKYDTELLQQKQKETETLGLLQSMPDLPKTKTKTKKYTDKIENKILITE